MRLTIELDFGALFRTAERMFGGPVSAEGKAFLFPRTMTRVRELANHGEALWKRKATKIPGQEGRPLRLNPYVPLNPTAYARSIQAVPDTAQSDELLAYRLFSSDPQAEYIESGSPDGDMDLHTVLPGAPKARKGKKGLYLRIPLRHATTAPGGTGGQRFQASGASPGSGILSSGVLRAMKDKPRYLRTAYMGTRPSETQPGKKIRRFAYSPAKPAQLTMDELQKINQRARVQKMTEGEMGRLKGLMHVGRKGHGHYLTIRTLSQANPEGWKIQAYPAQHVRESVHQELKQLSGSWFKEAIDADIEEFTDRVLGCGQSFGSGA